MVALVGGLVWAAAASAQPAAVGPPPEPEEVLLAYRYGAVAAGYVAAWHLDGAFYLPVGELFGALGVRHQREAGAAVHTGFYVRARRRYRLDFGRGEAEVEERHVRLEPGTFLLGEAEAYVRPEVFEVLFGLRCTVDPSSLSLHVQSAEPLPVALEAERARLRELRLSPGAADPAASPLAQRRPIIGGGVLDYTLSAEQGVGGGAVAYTARGGVEVLGGGLRYATAGRAGNAAAASHSVEWHRVFERGPLLTQLRAGDLVAGGVRPVGFRGLTWTNEPYEPRQLFAHHALVGHLEPEWEAELYLNDRLVDAALDPGAYRFDVPLGYGTTRLRTVEYGPHGEVRERRLRFETPAALVPAGEVRYTAHAGRAEAGPPLLAHAHAAAGLTDALTLRAGRGRENGLREGVYGGLTARFGVHHLLDVRAAPGGSARLSFGSTFPSQVALRVHHARHEPGAGAFGLAPTPRGLVSETSLEARLPLTVRDVSAGLDLQTARLRYTDYDEYRAQAFANASRGGVRARLRYDGAVAVRPEGSRPTRSLLSPSLSYHPAAPWATRLVRAPTLEARLQVDLLRRGAVRLEAQLSGSVGDRGTLHLGAEHDTRTGRSAVLARFVYRLPFARVSTQSRVQGGHSTHATSVRGSVGVDWGAGSVVLHDRALVGQGMATARVFVDGDGSGRYEPGETLVEGVDVRLRRGSHVRQEGPGPARFLGLRPHARYVLEVDATTIRDPFLVPRSSAFTFSVGSNGVTVLDVPLVRAGSVEGSVTRSVGAAEAPAGGVLVTLRREEDGEERTLRTFSDGTFFEFALPPGTWSARPDPDQLGRLGLAAAPAERRFTLRALPDGDVIEGLSFSLQPRPTETE